MGNFFLKYLNFSVKHLLLIVFIVICVGLLTSSLAFSENEMKNLLYQRVNVKFNSTDSKSIVDKIDISHMYNGHNYEDLTDLFNNDDYTYICIGESNLGTIFFFICDKVQGKEYIYNRNNDNYAFKVGDLTFPAIIWTANTLTNYNDVSSFKWYGSRNTGSFSSSPIYTGWFNTPYLNIYNYDVAETINMYAPYSNPSTWTVENGPYDVIDFGFQEADTNTHINFFGATPPDPVPCYYAPGNTIYFADFINSAGGTLESPQFIGHELSFKYYYMGNWQTKFLFDKGFDNGLYVGNRFINVINNGYFTEYKLSLNQPYIYKNVLYTYVLYYRNYNDPINTARTLYYYFYIIDSNTIIVNNEIDETSTFNNNYIPYYLGQFDGLDSDINNDNNTDLIVNTIKSGDTNIISSITDDSQVSAIIADYLNSGDILARFNFEQYGVSGDDTVYTIFRNIADVLLDDTDVYFDYSMHGESPTRIYASAFTTPDNKLIQFVRIFLVFIVMYAIYYNIKHIIDLINEGNAPLILQDEDVDIMLYKM